MKRKLIEWTIFGIAAIARGDTLVFSNDLAPSGSTFEQELEYLQQQGVFLGVPEN